MINRIKTKCCYCGNEIEIMPRDEGKRKFCNRNCQSKWQSEFLRGKNHPEYMERIVVICDNCGGEIKKTPSYIKKHNFCNQICKSKWQIKNLCNENNPNWKGGITSEDINFRSSSECKDWRVSVFERDDYTCQECGDKGGVVLNAHHILPYSDWREPRFSLNIKNGITLCEDCHRETFGREYEFFNKYFDIANGVGN